MTETADRPLSRIDRIAESFLDDQAALDPLMATEMGISGHDTQMPDLSPAGLAQMAQLRRDTLVALDGAAADDDNDRITVAALRNQLTNAEDFRATGREEAALDNIASPVQTVRAVFDLMPTEAVEDWGTIATRLAAVPGTLAGYIESLREARGRGQIVPRRQIEAAVAQCVDNTGTDGFFAEFARNAKVGEGALPATLQTDVERAAAKAAAAYATLTDFLTGELAPTAPTLDAVGREVYAICSRQFLGTSIDLEETYAWGQEELSRIQREQEDTAARLLPDRSIRDVMSHLDRDPQRQLSGTDALQAWMQERSDEAISALRGSHFDIPDAITRLECRIAPTHSGAIYYTGPSDDFSRPGRMWWSVPEGVARFSTWQELTTVYHEGVPGHHLQVAQTVFRRDMLNRWRRLGSWISGHGEGWALYAERLMAELGFLDDPGDYLGLLDSQSLRATRVVIDIGVHCGFEAPAEVGGGGWTYDKAWQLLTSHCLGTEQMLRFELDRYLGWPGQATSYKVGERIWLGLRDEAQRRAGDAFDLADFHRRALDIGGVGLDVLSQAVLAEGSLAPGPSTE